MNAHASVEVAGAASANDLGLPRKGYRNGGSQRRFDAIEARGSRFRLDDHPAIVEGRSIFQARVYDAAEVPRLLVSGVNSRKIGRVVAKGHWRGFPIFTLTLEERRTCPRSCTEWSTCYGNSMNWARRIATGGVFEHRLWEELAAKQAEHPAGFVVRLHVLGDFYSTDYVELWDAAMAEFPALRVFGYTTRPPESDIGALLRGVMGAHPTRFRLRFSGLDAPTDGSVVIERGAATPHIVCPAQTGATDCCATCALCWHSDRTVAFWRH
jgi:hypothetical protein